MAEEEGKKLNPPSKEAVGIQMILYKNLMRGTLTIDMLNEFQQYLDTDITIKACKPCSMGLDFGLYFLRGDVSDSTLEEHLNLIQSGYCQCHDVDTAEKTKVFGMRLIHRMAVSDKNLPLLSYLHRHGCDINAHSFNSKDTPLLIAIQLEQFETVKFLVENGADVNMGTGLPVYHVSPLRTALERGNHEIVKFLLGAEGINLNVCTKAYKESVLESSLNDYPDFIEMLVEAGCDPNCADRYGRTPLTVMANGRNRDMVKFLIQHGADVNKKDFSYCNTVPLLESVRLGDTETVAVLLEAGADPNFYSQFENKSLITQACCNGYADIIRLLIKHGADPNVCDKSGASGLWTAVYHGHKDVVKQLVLEFVEKEVPSCGMDRRRYYYQSPKSPLYVAIDKQHLEIALLLIRAGYSIHNEPWLPQRQFFESEEKAELLQELLKLTDTPPSLLIICRNHLHNYLRGHDLPQKVDKLDLPTFLKKYLLYADLQDA